MTRRIKHYDTLSPIWRKQILSDLKYKTLNLLDVAINQSSRKAVLVNNSGEEWLVILNFSPKYYDEEDEHDDYSSQDDDDSYEGDFDENDNELNNG